jgi:SRSO17 transposase
LTARWSGFTNCQVGVFLSYVSRRGHAFINRALYLPKAWAEDATRLKAAYVPSVVNFATKPQLAARMKGPAKSSYFYHLVAGFASNWRRRIQRWR